MSPAMQLVALFALRIVSSQHGDEHGVPTIHKTPPPTDAVGYDAINDCFPASTFGRMSALGFDLTGLVSCPETWAPSLAENEPLAPTEEPVDAYDDYVTHHNMTLHQWGYSILNGPETWPGTYPDCQGRFQSPINIITSAVPTADVNVPLRINYRSTFSPGDLYVANNGHAVEVGAIRPDVLKTSTAKLGDAEYELKQIHMHVKSENTIDGVRAAMEMHFVHRSLFPGGVVLVVSVMYDEAPHDNLGIRKLKWGGLEPIDWEGDTPLDMQRKPLGAFDLTELLPAWIRVKKTDDYFYFEGSFTTPPCTEGVRWVIVRSRHFVSHAQLLTHPFRDNFRPTQPMFAGVVRRSAPCTGTCLGLNSTAPALPNVTQVMRTTLITGNNAMWLSGGLLLVCPDRFARACWRGCALDAGVLFAGNPTGF